MAQLCPLIHTPQPLRLFAFPILFVYTLLTENLQQTMHHRLPERAALRTHVVCIAKPRQNTTTFYRAVQFSNVCANKYAIISQLLTLTYLKSFVSFCTRSSGASIGFCSVSKQTGMTRRSHDALGPDGTLPLFESRLEPEPWKDNYRRILKPSVECSAVLLLIQKHSSR
jgi:hypothetical protein